MQLKDNIGVIGQVSIVLMDAETGQIKTRREINNLVVQTGKNLVAANFAGTSSDTVTHIALGGGTTAASSGQTALVTPYTPRVACTTNVTANPATVVYESTFGPGVVTNSIAEAGLFTASTAGTMVARTTFSAIPKGANDLLVVTWTLIFG